MTQFKHKKDLFSVKVRKGGQGGKKKGKKQQDGDKHTQSRKAIKKDRLATLDVEPLTYQTLAVGQVVLGCVFEVRDYELLVSLPHKMMGTVSLVQVSRPYTNLLSKLKDQDKEEEGEEIHALQELYTRGQYVVASVVSISKTDKLTKVNLTLMPNEVNFGIAASVLAEGLVLSCAVASVEDKGYALDTGIAGVNGAFLKKKHTDHACCLGVGSVLPCIITKVYGSDTEDSLRLTFRADPQAVNAVTFDLTDTTNLALLLPGTAVKTTISKVRKDALTLVLAGGVDGVVSPLHLREPFDLVHDYTLGESVGARVLYITPLSKVVHFTLQDIAWGSKAASESVPSLQTGAIIREAEIYKTSSSGIFMKLDAQTRGFCSGNRLLDTNKVMQHVTRDFPKGKKVTCRLMKYNYLDRLFITNLQRSVLKEQFVSYGELKAGQVVAATVSECDSTGAQLAISKVVSGHVPSMHLTDNTAESPQEAPCVGDSVSARVLKVNPGRQHLLLTLNTSLVKAKEPIINKYATTATDTITIGYVIKIMPWGLLVGMFNDVKGFVPKAKAGILPSEELGAVFQVGQAVRCKVVKVFPDKQNIILSLNVDDAAKPVVDKAVDEVKLRSRVECVVKEVQAHLIKVTLTAHNIEAVIPVQHLSDDPHKCKLLQQVIKVKDEISDAVVFSKTDNSITLTLKASVCFWIDNGNAEVLESHELVAEEIYPSVVYSIKNFGVFVMIPAGNRGKVALVHMKNINVLGKMDMEDLGIQVGQSLYVSYQDTDDKDRPILTTTLKHNLKNATQSSLQLLYSYLKNEEMVTRGLLSRDTQDQHLAKYTIGDKVVATVTEVTPQEIHVEAKNGVRGVVSVAHLSGKEVFKVDQKVKFSVLYVNQEEKRLELTKKPKLMLNTHANKAEKLKIGMKVKCEVVLARDSFTMVVMKSDCKGTVAYLPSVPHLNRFKKPILAKVGKKCEVMVKHIDGPLVLGVLVSQHKREELSLTCKLPDIIYSHEGEEEEVDEEMEDSEMRQSNGLIEPEQSKKKATDPLKTTLPESPAKSAEKTQKNTKKRKTLSEETKKAKKVKSAEVVVPEHDEEDVTKAECEEEEKEAEAEAVKPCLALNTGFVWHVPDALDDSTLSDASDSDDEAATKRKSKQLRKSSRAAAAHEEEQRLHQLELSRLEENQTPQSALEFEALLQRSPNSSAVWIQFVSFHLESAEVDKAKSVAQRALQVISPEEEEERLNVWTVLLRLEVMYGSPEAVAELYKEALVTNDHLKIHMAMAMVYAESNKLKEAEKVYFNVTKKFGHNPDVWIKAGIFFYTHHMAKEGRHYLDRALHSLDNKDHVEVINRFGQLEFRFGEMERGRTMFESLLSTYWKRMDIWSVFVDLLAKKKDIDGARHVLERMASLKLKLQKMRFVFKKFLAFEKEHGNPQSVEAVKQRVEEFVATTLH